MDRLDEIAWEVHRITFYSRYGKRMVDIILSFTLSIFLLPLIIFSIIFIFWKSGRPVFFRQTRSGLNDSPFVIWKFRTLQDNGDKKIFHLYKWQGKVPDDFLFSTPRNQIYTKCGRLFRKFSLDELPQLWNVLKGNMSIVGPRPEILEITSHYSPHQKQRLLVKPGITGYAQVNGRSSISHGEKVTYDLYYVHNCSFWLDIKIILKTVFCVISGKGAT